MKLPRLKGKLRKPQGLAQKKSLASRDFFRREQKERISGDDFGGNTVWLINDDNLLIDGLQVVS